MTPDIAIAIAAIETAERLADVMDYATTGAEGQAWGNCCVALGNAMDYALEAQRAYQAMVAANQRPEKEERYP